MRIAALIALGMIASPALAGDPVPKVVPQFVGVWDKAPDMICTKPNVATRDDYGFALALLYSLAYGRDATDRAAEIKPALAGVKDMTSLMTELLRISKEQSSDFACAETPLASFNQSSTDTTVRMVAQNMLFTWHQQIELNDRMNSFTKNIETMKSADMADRMSTLQVDRNNLWKTMHPIVEVVLLRLVDDKRISSANTLPYLIINKIQKDELIAKVREYFPEVEKQEQKDMDSPTYDASLYLYLLTTRKASDEV